MVSGYESVHVKDALAHPSGLVLDMAVRAGSDSACPRRGKVPTKLFPCRDGRHPAIPIRRWRPAWRIDGNRL